MIVDWLLAFGPRLFACALQVAIFAIIVSVLCMRNWSPQSPNIPLIGLLAILVLTLGRFVPLPGWTNSSLDWVEGMVLERKNHLPTFSSRSEDERVSAIARESFENNQQSYSSELGGLEGWRSWLSKGFEPATESIPIAPLEFRQIVSSKLSFSWTWLAYSIPILALPIGLYRLLAGFLSLTKLKKNSVVINDPRLSQLLAELTNRSNQGISFDARSSPYLASPATTGILKQVLWLPMDWNKWSDLELRGILAHELAHFRNRDHVAQLMAQACLALHFYNPIVHWLVNRLRLEQEWAADQSAAEALGGSRKYLSLLAELALKHEARPKGFAGWPITQFLGGRTLLRRVKMLKSTTVHSRSNCRAVHYAACTLIFGMLVGLLGLSPVDSIAAPVLKSVEEKTTDNAQEEQKKEFDLRYVGDQSNFVVAIRPKDLTKNQFLKETINAFESLPTFQSLATRLGFKIQTLEQIIIEGTITNSQLNLISCYAQSSFPFDSFEKTAVSPVKLGETTVYEMPNGFLVWFPTPNSFVVRKKDDGNTIANLIAGRHTPSLITQSDVWKRLSRSDSLFVANKNQSLAFLEELKLEVARGNGMFAMVATIIQEAEFWGMGVSASTDELVLNLRVLNPDETSSQIAKEALEATTILAKVFVREFQRVTKSDVGFSQMLGVAPANAEEFQQVIVNDARSSPSKQVGALSNNPSLNDIAQKVSEIALSSLQAAKIEKEANMIFAETKIRCDPILAKRFSSLLIASREAANRSGSSNNLKQIALGFHNHEDAFQTFPHSKLNAPKSNHPYSWRIAILPYIGERELYDMYRFDEPWDSESNKKLLAKMPSLFRHPAQPFNSTTTDYVVLVGTETVFQPNRPSKLSDITDGTSTTLLVVEAKTNIPWTKPEDLSYESGGPLPRLGGFADNGFNAVRADASVLFVDKSIDESLLRAMITARGSEVIPAK